MMFRVQFFIFALSLAIVPLVHATEGGGLPDQNSPKCDPAELKGKTSIDVKFVRVVDGDTVKINYNGKLLSVRMLTMDTPETHYEGQSQGFWGDTAAAKLAELTRGVTLARIELGEEACDHYGRILGYLWVGEKNINREMIAEGLAVNFCVYPSLKHCEEFANLVQKNIDDKRGIFSGDPEVDLPYNWRREISNRPYDKFVGNLETFEVVSPEKQEQVPVSQRVFFMKKSAIKAPFHYVGK